jgi:hypothetical protein
MKSFIEHIQKSIYSPEYYKELLTRPASFSWKYYGNLAMFLALFLTITSSLSLVPLIGKTLNDFPKIFLAYYPDELEVRITNGHASSTVAEPYFLPLPEFVKESMGSSTGILYLGVIDTGAPASLERFQPLNALFSISENALIMRDQQNGVRISPFGPDFNYVLNERVLSDFILRIEPYFKFVAPAVVLIVFLGMLLTFSVELMYLVFAALLVFVMGRILKHKWTYGTAFRICLHAATLPLLLSVAFSLVDLGMESLPFLSTILLLVVVFFNLRNVSPEVPVSAHEAPSLDHQDSQT